MTSAEIRQALRDGVVDPFDLVSREGSALKVELVEVDEIFDPRHQEPVVPVVPAAKPEPVPVQPKIAVNAPPQPMVLPSAPPAPTTIEPTPMESFGEMTASGRKRRAALKKFYLIDRRGRVLGPLSAAEIQSLYQRGIVEKSVRVQKVGEPKSIPLNLFISAYAGERMTALGASNSDIRQTPGVTAMKSSKVLNELYMSFSTGGGGRSRFRPYIGVILVGVFLGLLVFFSLNFDNQDDSRARRSLTRERVTRERSTPTLRRIPERPKPAVARQAPSAPAAAPTPPSSERRAPRAERVRPLPATPPPRPQRPVERTAPPARPAPEFNLQDGAVVTLSNLEFKKADLEDCALKCRLTFYRGGRRAVTAVFFKGAFEDSLRATRGSVTIQGSVKREGSGYVLFLQDVR